MRKKTVIIVGMVGVGLVALAGIAGIVASAELGIRDGALSCKGHTPIRRGCAVPGEREARYN